MLATVLPVAVFMLILYRLWSVYQGCANTPLITPLHITGAVSREDLRFMLTPHSGREG